MPAVPLASEDIYDALIDDESFARLPARLVSAYGGRSCVILWRHPAGGAEVLSHCGQFTDAQMGLYSSHFAAHEPWGLTATEKRGGGAVEPDVEELVSSDDYANSVFYNELIRGTDDDHFRCMGVRIANPWGVGYVAVDRGQGEDSFDSQAAAALDQNVAALRRMLAMRGRLAVLDRMSGSLQSTLDRIARSVILVSRDGVLIHANRAGDDLLRNGGALVLRKGFVSAAVPAMMPALLQAIDQACNDGVEGAPLLMPRAGGRPLALMVIPVRDRPFSRAALLVAGEDVSPRDDRLPRLKTLYGLTSAESEIASRVADGTNPTQIARERRVSVATVRSQIKALAAKLGVKRQAEISALINGLPPLIVRAD